MAARSGGGEAGAARGGWPRAWRGGAARRGEVGCRQRVSRGGGGMQGRRHGRCIHGGGRWRGCVRDYRGGRRRRARGSPGCGAARGGSRAGNGSGEGVPPGSARDGVDLAGIRAGRRDLTGRRSGLGGATAPTGGVGGPHRQEVEGARQREVEGSHAAGGGGCAPAGGGGGGGIGRGGGQDGGGIGQGGGGGVLAVFFNGRCLGWDLFGVRRSLGWEVVLNSYSANT